MLTLTSLRRGLRRVTTDFTGPARPAPLPPPTPDPVDVALALLDTEPLTPAVTMRALEDQDFPAILNIAVPGAVLRHRWLAADRREFVIVDPADHGRHGVTAVRAVLHFDRGQNRTVTQVASIGEHSLWDRIVVACDRWEMAGRRLDPVRPVLAS